MTAATRYLSAFSNVDVAIAEAYTYGGVGGRVSKRVVERGDAGATPVPFFEQEFTWTELGDLETVTYPNCVIAGGAECKGDPSRVVTYTYDNGFLTGITGYASSIEYHPNEMLKSIQHTNGVTDEWAIDPVSMRRPARIQTTGATGGSNFDTGTYAYDGAGNITAMGSDTFGYDGVSRLVSGTAMGGQAPETSGFDAFGNRTDAITVPSGDRTIPVDPSTNRLIDGEFQRFLYDDRGNLTEWWTEDPDPQVTTEVKAKLDVDPFDMIERLREDGDGVPPEVEVAYVYTADDERIATFRKVPSVSETWTLRDLDGQVLREYFRSPGVEADWQKDTIRRHGQVLATESLTGREDAHLDHLGTIRLWTGAGGSVSAHHSYSAFGEEIVDTQDGQSLRFTGHERDVHRFGECSGTTSVDDQVITEGGTFVGCDVLSSDNTTVDTTEEVRFLAGNKIALSEFTIEAGAEVVFELNGALSSGVEDLDYMHARYYSPGIGRFLSVDPIDSSILNKPQSWNKYAYVFNNPLKWVDPNGECAATPGLTEGLVGICIEGFIGRKRIGGIGLGDNRGFEASDPEATARVSLNMLVDPQTGQVVGEPSVTAGVSKVGFNETFSVGLQGTASALFLDTSDAPSDVTQFRILLSGRNGLAALNNLGAIQALVDLSIDRQGDATGGGVTKGFPSIAGYAYKIVQGELVIEVLFERPEGDPGELNHPMDKPLTRE